MNITNSNPNMDLSKAYKDQDIQKVLQPEDRSVPKSRSLSSQELSSLVNDLNNNPVVNRKLQFGFNKVSDIFYMSVLDSKTNKVIKEYSNDEALNIAKKLDELSGIIFDERT
jgi:flagellar protein FlaG